MANIEESRSNNLADIAAKLEALRQSQHPMETSMLPTETIEVLKR